MSFEPVFLSPGRELKHRASQTFMRHYNSCPRSGFLYAETKSSLQTIEMLRGTVVHEINARCTLLMLELGEPMIPWELAKTIVAEVLAEYPLPLEEHDYVRECAFRWASHFTIAPAQVIAVETLIALEINGWQVRCKVDFAELREEGRQLYVGDYKSGKGAPAYDDISRKRTDGTIAARNFQLILYALAAIYGKPVRVEWRTLEEGELMTPDPNASYERVIGNRLMREYVEPYVLAPRASEVIGEFIYPGIKAGDGTMLRREVGLTALELAEYRESIAAKIANLQHSEESGDWPAVQSELACDECPAKQLCPIPRELRDHRGEINSMDELVEAAQRIFVDDAELRARKREFKATAKQLGGPSARVRFGEDLVWELGDVTVSREIPDKDGMIKAIERAVEFGEPFDIDDWMKTRESTPFSKRRLSEDELEEEREQEEAVAGG